MAAQRCQPRMPAIVCMASIHSLQFVARDSDVLVHVAVAAQQSPPEFRPAIWSVPSAVAMRCGPTRVAAPRDGLLDG